MLRDEVEATLAGMTWLDEPDRALRALALKLAEEIDTARARAEEFGELESLISPRFGEIDQFKRLQRLEAWCDVAKTVGMLGPRLQSVLKDLGATPAVREKFATSNDGVTGRASRLAGLRALQGGRDAG